MAPLTAGRSSRALVGVLAGALAAAGVTLLPNPAPLHAQVVAGTVLEETTGRYLVGARVTLFDAQGTAHGAEVADSLGQFALRVPHAASWTLSVQLVGYEPLVTEPIPVDAAEMVVVEITLAVDAIPLAPLVVMTRRSMRSPDIQAFYDRKERAGRSGFGNFVAREEIERGGATRPTDLVRSMAGVRIVRGAPGRGAGIRMAGGCIPAIFIDGMPINRTSINDSLDDYVTTLDIEGIEVYRGPTSQLGSLHDPNGCGLVAVWTRRGEPQPGTGVGWRKMLTAGAILAAIFFILN
jgi:hypothetical protein